MINGPPDAIKQLVLENLDKRIVGKRRLLAVSEQPSSQGGGSLQMSQRVLCGSDDGVSGCSGRGCAQMPVTHF